MLLIASVGTVPVLPSAAVSRVMPVVVATAVLGTGIVAASPAHAHPAAAPVIPLTREQAALRPVLRPGDTGLWVRRLHRALHIVPARQPFGRATSRAIIRFRVAHRLSAHPVVTVRTWMALGSLVVVGRRRAQGPAPSGPLPGGGDPTITDTARNSRAYRASLGVARFASSATARTVVTRESGGQCAIADPSGTYRGKWQMDASFWATYGGRQFAARPDLATCAQQDIVAYRGWVDRWWQPWSTAAW